MSGLNACLLLNSQRISSGVGRRERRWIVGWEESVAGGFEWSDQPIVLEGESIDLPEKGF
jgi:hypothetical protein